MDIHGRDAKLVLDAYNSGQVHFHSEQDGYLTGFEDRNRDCVYYRSNHGRIFRYDRSNADRRSAQLNCYNSQIDVFEPWDEGTHFIPGERYEILQRHELLTRLMQPQSVAQQYLGMSWRDLGRAFLQLVVGGLLTAPVNRLGVLVQHGLGPLLGLGTGRQHNNAARQQTGDALAHPPLAAAAQALPAYAQGRGLAGR